MRSPGSQAKSVRTCQVLRPRPVAQALALARLDILPSATQTASAPGISFLSRLNGWPARSPTDERRDDGRRDYEHQAAQLIEHCAPFTVRFDLKIRTYEIDRPRPGWETAAGRSCRHRSAVQT